jgi:hypothetical protein
LTSDPHLYIVRFVQAIRRDNLLADAVGSPLFRKRAAQLPVVHDLLGGERRSQVLAVDDHAAAEQEQSADALFDLHPQREGAGERDDGRDGHQHDG